MQDSKNKASQIKDFLWAPFLNDGKVDIPVLVLFLAINLLVFANAILHHPEIGYDANDHLLYMQVLPERLPGKDDTREFFSAPLPYLIPSLVSEACESINTNTIDCRFWGGKSGQIINILLSIGTTFLLVKISHTTHPENRYFKFSTLLFLGLLPVYYKTFSQFRGEPYVAFFAMLAAYLMLNMLAARHDLSWKNGVQLGIVLGALALSRQWGFLVFPAVVGLAGLLVILEQASRRKLVQTVSISLAVAFLLSSWFYFNLYTNYGKFTAFNRNPQGFSLINKPATFYRNTGLQNLQLFKTPTLGYFNDMLIPTFYTEVWGDYWGFYILPNLIPEVLELWDWDEMDYAQVQQYMGRVNLVSVFPSMLYLAGIATGLVMLTRWLISGGEPRSPSTLSAIFVVLLLLFSAAGYFWFLLTYPSAGGDTIKATYMLHVLILLPILVAEFLERLRGFRPWLYNITVLLVIGIVLHNLQAMITRYSILAVR